ncbi:uncharacterized protein LOC129586604 [Paramacrobiotus metropolitanus]|uniref:uncharacterized protein LOC129586604 n=1 Tax=Paramacrobiotus metropolitanus TaxID=2943436 RepID=UPI002445BCD3|nr:uncharacterized protein LOC129586604 [Paramacrobiotus metropolitanus]
MATWHSVMAIVAYAVCGVYSLEQKDMAVAAAEGIPVHEVPSVILLAPDQLSVLKVLGDRLKMHHVDTDQFLMANHDPDGEVLDVDMPGVIAQKKDKTPGKPFNANTDPDGRYSAIGNWEHFLPPLKRRAGGKLCYINPIACFGRRQREAAN